MESGGLPPENFVEVMPFRTSENILFRTGCLFFQPDKFDFAFIEVSLSYSTISRIVKRFVISALPDARSITGPEASKTFFWLCLFIVLFMSFSDVCPYLAHLLNALLGGKGAPSPARPLLGTNYCRIYQIIQK